MSDYILNNRYRLLAQIASGGMAVVYKAHDTVLNRVVAVKILRETFADDASFRARFQTEAQSAANLAHPNIVTVYDFGQDGSRTYIVMEYVEGRDLKSLIRSDAPLPLDRALDLFVQACAGLGYAHRAGLVHCDVKPQNMLVTNDGRLKVTDFGIARAISEVVPRDVETVWGTPHYFSPEQASGETPTPASDVYSLGVMLYEMLSGRLPFEGDSHTDLAMAHLRDAPPPLTSIIPSVPIQIEQIINKVMSKEPSSRYRTADQLGRIIVEYRRQAEQATGMLAPTPPPITTHSEAINQPSSVVQPIGAERTGNTDWLAWILGTLAVIAVIGLIPLLFLVVRAYSEPLPPKVAPKATPTLSSTVSQFGEQVLVPNLIGRTEKDAEQFVSSAGLTIVLGDTRFDAHIPKGSVVEQNPPVGKLAARGSSVTIYVSDGPQVSPVVNVMNFIYEDVASGLKTYGWDIRLVEEYNSQPYHKVLNQEPVAGVPLAAGEPFTLTVSAGTTLTLQVDFAHLITLESANLPIDLVRPGEVLNVTFWWRAQHPIPTPYTVFVHLIGPTGLVQQIDSEPGGGSNPTTNWPVNLPIADAYVMQVPANAPKGEYQLRVGLYPSGQATNRLPVVDVGKTSMDQDSVLIKMITVQ
jgi:serine/threonine-protein kinase